MSQINPTPSGSTAAQTTANPEVAVLQYEQQIIDAIRQKNLTKWQNLVAEDWCLIDWQGQVINREQMFNALSTRDINIAAIEGRDLEARVYGDTAIVIGKVIVKGRYQGQDISGQYRVMDIWTQQSGQWQIVAAQQTPIQHGSGAFH
jgi:ketosteroid isomerase-like protein